ncbi:hypothetical protein EMIT0347P_20649 [Pseudomonas sp. IT-347P]
MGAGRPGRCGHRVDRPAGHNDPELDQCDATLGKGCIPRFGEGNPLPFGGFPAKSGRSAVVHWGKLPSVQGGQLRLIGHPFLRLASLREGLQRLSGC